MSGSIHKVWLARPTEAWYQLSVDQQQALLAELTELGARLGGKEILFCFSGWSSEQWTYFGVEEYPNIEAVQALADAHLKMGWYRYLESMTILGTRAPASSGG